MSCPASIHNMLIIFWQKLIENNKNWFTLQPEFTPQRKTVKIRANGKILLTGEYAVLDGALALALPTKLGQGFEIVTGRGSDIKWKSLDKDGAVWFTCTLSLFDFSTIKASDDRMAERLATILSSACKLNSDFLSSWKGVKVTSRLEFDRDMGLGSSATLIYCIAKWADVDAYELLALSMGGSGYDLACCDQNKPIFFQRLNGTPKINAASFDPVFKDKLYFASINKKVDSTEEINEYRQVKKSPKQIVEELTDLTQKISKVKRFSHFEHLISRHEDVLSEFLGRQKVQERLFKGYWGKIKSLGAWGGDMILVTSDRSKEETLKYFVDRGFDRIFGYDELVLSDN